MKKKVKKKYQQSDPLPKIVEDLAVPYSFKVRVGGKTKTYSVQSGYGYFIPSFKKASNLIQIQALIEKGIASKELEPLIQYLGFKVPEISKAASVSASTISRWEPTSSIGTPGSGQFFKIDEVIRKGVALFGGESEFRVWLNLPNMALGNVTPARLVTSAIGVEMVDEALDALHFGTVL